eukprot:1183043-Lingulodinium_polyedra.AAC.1
MEHGFAPRQAEKGPQIGAVWASIRHARGSRGIRSTFLPFTGGGGRAAEGPANGPERRRLRSRCAR